MNMVAETTIEAQLQGRCVRSQSARVITKASDGQVIAPTPRPNLICSIDGPPLCLRRHPNRKFGAREIGGCARLRHHDAAQTAEHFLSTDRFRVGCRRWETCSTTEGVGRLKLCEVRVHPYFCVEPLLDTGDV
jgi:hypothetical protein